jgi:hypothetical protein
MLYVGYYELILAKQPIVHCLNTKSNRNGIVSEPKPCHFQQDLENCVRIKCSEGWAWF